MTLQDTNISVPPPKYGNQFADNQIRTIAERWFGPLKPTVGRDKLVAMLEVRDTLHGLLQEGLAEHA